MNNEQLIKLNKKDGNVRRMINLKGDVEYIMPEYAKTVRELYKKYKGN